MAHRKREQGRLIRSKEQAWVVLIFAIFILGLFVAPSVVGLVGTAKAWALGPLGLLISPSIWATWRLFRAGVRVSPEAATIVNMRKTIVVPWTDIDHFSLGASSMAPKVGIAHLRCGGRIVIWGIQGPNPATRPKNRSAEHLIEELNAELQERVAGTAAAEPAKAP